MCLFSPATWLCLAMSTLAWAKHPPSAPIKTPFEIPRAESSIKVDGNLDELVWKKALHLNLAYEVRPGENTQPPVDTDLYLAFTQEALLVAFVAHDPRPGEIRARYSDRDRIWKDDWVGIVLDTFNDERRAYELMVNPLGAQLDAINDDMNGNYDTSWNAIWDSAGRITDQGYQVEMLIPFNQLKFQESDGFQIWGLDAVRSYPRRHRHHIGLFARDRGHNSYLAQEEKIRGFEGARSGKNLEIVPTFTAGRTDVADCTDCGLTNGDADEDMGVTARWGVTPNITLSGTINPDFSQVEADVVKLALNEQFALFFPESRPFFLEGKDYFSTGLNLVHTRTIADPSTAAKVTGKSGRHTYGAFTAQDEHTSILIPGAEGSSAASFAEKSDNHVARYRYDYGRNSSVGALLTWRTGQNGYRNSVLSVDARHRFSAKDQITFNYAGSQTRYSPEIQAEFGMDQTEVDDSAGRISYSHSERNWGTFTTFQHYGKGFRADLGFQPRVGFRKLIIGGNYMWHGKPDTFYNRLEVSGDWDQTETVDGDLIEREIEGRFRFNGPKESWFNTTIGQRTRVYEQISYDQNFVNVSTGMTVNGSLSFGSNFNKSDWIDFGHNRAAERFSMGPNMRLDLGRHFKLTMRYNYTKLDVAEGNLFTAKVPEARLNIFFNRRTMIRTVLQFTDITRDPDVYDPELYDEVASRSRDLLTQLLFSYKLNPQTVAYAGYTDSYIGENSESLLQTERTFFAKVGYAWLR